MQGRGELLIGVKERGLQIAPEIALSTACSASGKALDPILVFKRWSPHPNLAAIQRHKSVARHRECQVNDGIEVIKMPAIHAARSPRHPHSSLSLRRE
ncbi:hypothetical protein [Bradyrhizobium brasilense]|uniref:hypothetical protein n=1 Tax=Bradyrhizobium brasilense TaxID=1419277 RepID=UPI000B8A0DAF|nr:hypothetical protein [Bradyrhizobium brasilense]